MLASATPGARRRPLWGAAVGDVPRDGEIDRLIVQQYDPGHRDDRWIDTCLRVSSTTPRPASAGRRGYRHSGSAELRWGAGRRCSAATGSLVPPGRADRHHPPQGLSSRTRRGSSPVCCATGPGSRAPQSVQAHRVDVGLFTRLLFRGPLVYCIHTQERGLLGPTSDSFWRFLGGLTSGWTGRSCGGRTGDRVQPGLRREGAAVEPAHGLRAHVVRPRDHLRPGRCAQPVRRRLGRQARGAEGPRAGRRAFAALAREEPDEPWTLEVIGSGHPAARARGADRRPAARRRRRITLRGRLAPPTSPRHGAAPGCSS